MENILTSTYSDGSKVNAVLSPYDGISRGIISALTDAGYTVGAEWPVISGQDAELDSVKAINSGEQYATIFKDTRELAKVAVDMAVAAAERRRARGQQHRGLRQRQEGRPVVPARVADRRQGQHPGGPGRLRLLDRSRDHGLTPDTPRHSGASDRSPAGNGISSVAQPPR